MIPVADVGEFVPYDAMFHGDLDPESRQLQGDISLVGPIHSTAQTGYRAYSTGDGNTNIDAFPLATLKWAKSCPPNMRNDDFAQHHGFEPSGAINGYALLPCGNDNPYSPKCRGKSCPFISILPGPTGDFYITRARTSGNGVSGEPQNYTENEIADIYLPEIGELEVVMMSVPADSGDSLTIYTDVGWGCTTDPALKMDLTDVPIQYKVTTPVHMSILRWRTDLSGILLRRRTVWHKLSSVNIHQRGLVHESS